MPGHLGECNTKYLTLMRADSGRAVMRARSRRAYARRLPACMHSWPPARKSRARCKLQTRQPQLTEHSNRCVDGNQSLSRLQKNTKSEEEQNKRIHKGSCDVLHAVTCREPAVKLEVAQEHHNAFGPPIFGRYPNNFKANKKKGDPNIE